MSPTVFIDGPYRFFFFSREERRMHIHVMSSHGEAKFWLEPEIVLAENDGLSKKEISQVSKVVEARKDEIKANWEKHFKC